MNSSQDILISLAVQFPLLVLFVIYNERKDRNFQAFLKEQRESFITTLEKLASILTEHDKKTDAAIARMMERTQIRDDKRKD